MSFYSLTVGGGGSGTVTDVTWTGGIVSIATSTTTPAFTITGTSGGIPYFSGTNTWESSAALAANAMVVGGGAGAAPVSRSNITSNNSFLQLGAATPLRFADSDSSNYVSLQSPATVVANNAYTLPDALPTVNASTLVCTTAGVMSWASPLVAPTSVEYLVVAGGGGGGGWIGGGGGAGGYRTNASFAVSSGVAITVTVGGGGAGGVYPGANKGASGVDSVFSTITSAGGGGGGSYGNPSSSSGDGVSGGSGGGGGGKDSGTSTGGAGNTPSQSPSQGNTGGNASSTNPQWSSGGGGGAGAIGTNAGSSQNGGAGGAGTASSITGSSLTYAGGGGGSGDNSGGAGGSGGGGAGGTTSGGATGTVNTGGGGGGLRDQTGKAGGSGVVIIAYPDTFAPITTISGGLTYSVSTVSRPGYRVYTFTAGTGTIQW